MLRQSARLHSILVFDFLAPSLIFRTASTSSTYIPKPPYPFTTKWKATPTFPTTVFPSDDTAVIFSNLRSKITELHSRDIPNPSDATVFNEAIAHLRKGLIRNDLHAVRKHWLLLEKNNLSYFLGPTQLKALSKLVSKICTEARPSDSLDTDEQLAIEDIALAAASVHAYDAINACMLLYIKKRDSDAAIALYQRFEGLVGRGDEKDVEGDLESHDALASIPDSGGVEDHGRRSILIAVTIAYAMCNSFDGALRTWLRSSTRVSKFSLAKYFDYNMPKTTHLRQRVETYVDRLILARVVSLPVSFSKRIHSLAKEKSVNSLETYYNNFIHELRHPNSCLTIDQTPASNEAVLVPEVGWTTFLTGFIQCRRFDLAEKLWDDMVKFGVTPGVTLWTALLDAYDGIGALEAALAAWKAMHSAGVAPDGLAYRALISVLFNNQKLDEAMQYFQIFQHELEAHSTLETSLFVYNTVLHGLLVTSQESEAISLLQKMKDIGPIPDVTAYNTFMRYYGRRGDFKAIASIIKKMTEADVVGDVFTFSTILSALLKTGRQEAPDMMLTLMQKQGVKPNVATYSTIIDQQMREQTLESLQAALRLLHKMELDPDAQPNEVTYTAILAGIYRGKWLSLEQTEQTRVDVERRMKERDILPNRVTYQILIKACLEHPEPEGLKNALRYFEKMLERKIPAVQDTWYIILEGLIRRRDWEAAEDMVTRMFRSGFKPPHNSNYDVNAVDNALSPRKNTFPIPYRV